MDEFLPFIQISKKEKEFQQIPLYIEDFIPEYYKEEKEIEVKENFIIIEII